MLEVGTSREGGACNPVAIVNRDNCTGWLGGIALKE